MKLITIKIFCLLFALQSYAMMPETQAILDLYQPTEKLATLKSEYDFWKKKSTAHPTQHAFKVQLANANTALFSATAELKYLKEAEYLLEAVRTAESNQKASTLRALAHNFISQHRFCEAMNLVLRAQEIGSEKRATDLMLFDLYEELGDDAAQKNTLAKLAEQQDFNYYIRLAKWQDGQGNLDQTIELMKVAEKIAETSKQTALKIWVYTNLADYYGHAGEIATSKSYYLKALALNSADWYSMKGLAWMAYANDRAPQTAIAILDKIATQSADPGITLLKAEILAYTGQTKAAHHKHNEVAKLVSQADYGNMYNSFLCEHYLQTNKFDAAMNLAKQEIALRAIPHSYDLLAQVYFAQGKIKEARAISKKHIWDQTFEPNILKQQLLYFQGTSEEILTTVRTELEAAQYEIGPLAYQEIKKESRLTSSLN